ncbi:MAG TPA: hypothetical protein VKC17_06290 [Sphingomicrobium sp.]|nr:hypothetical protein [Sphingomicrobium sp.]
MSDSRVALGLDRLPWLPDEPARVRKPSGNMVGWAAVAILLVAGLAYWLGLRSGEETSPTPESSFVRPEATVRLPDASAQHEVQPVTVPKVEPIVAPPIPVMESQPTQRKAPVERVRPKVEPAVEATAAEAEPEAAVTRAPAPPRPAVSGPWPVRVVDGASGRLIRVGAFRTAHQAKKGWWAIVRVNPALKHLPALVVPVQSLRNGRVYYRLQMGTTSQAHSTVLCQRMRMIAQSCVVIDEREVGL